jgi:predicted metal-dependent hydrolase
MNEAIANGVALFNSHDFWHAHEAWEAIWLTADGDEKRFLQGLIQLAAAYHHVKCGTLSGAIRLFDAAAAKLDAFPEGYLDVMRAEAVAVSIVHRERVASGERIDAGEYPKLSYNSSTSSNLRNLTQ